MATDNEVLWIVTQRHWLDYEPSKVYVFRTRYAARKFRAEKASNKRNKHNRYTVRRATWGPEQ